MQNPINLKFVSFNLKNYNRIRSKNQKPPFLRHKIIEKIMNVLSRQI